MTVTPRWQHATSLLALEISIDHLLGTERTQAAHRRLKVGHPRGRRNEPRGTKATLETYVTSRPGRRIVQPA